MDRPMPIGNLSFSRRDLLGLSLAAGAGLAASPLLGSGQAHAATVLSPAPWVKTRSTYYTDAKVRAARENISTYLWAQEVRDTAVAQADALVAMGDEWAWSQVTTQGLPRSYAVNQTLGSPLTGRDIYKYGNYPWQADIYGRPWKMVDPSSGYVFPTNDFWAFYQSALDGYGKFDRARGDSQYLVNTLYPERGSSWGVEDGYGWIDASGGKWTFAAYYNHWFAWYGPKALVNHLNVLRDAYLFTGDLVYAHAGLVMLDRVADVYPSMDTSVYRKQDGYLNSDGGSGRGKVVGCIWETALARDLCSVYDALFPAVASGDDAGVVPFLSVKAAQYDLVAKPDVEAVRANIENGLLRQIYPSVKAARIRGNFGMHQSTLAMAAVVQDDPVESREWIDFVFKPGQTTTTKITGGNVYAALVNDVDRDGNGNEAAPGYNILWLAQIKGIADVLAGYESYPNADLYQNVKFRKMHGSRYALNMLNAYCPSIGDSGSTGRPGLFGTSRDYVFAFEKYGGVEDAQLAYQRNGNSTEGLYGDIFSLGVEGTAAAIQKVVDQNGPLSLPTANLTGFGFAALRDGVGDNMRATSIYYGSSGGHGHKDTLNLGLWARGVDLLPDLGYPEFADASNRRTEWNGNTIAHNTVVVDAAPQAPHSVGTPFGFADGEMVKFADVAAPKAYPQTSLYRRATAMVRIDEANAYTFDVFRVVGGGQHDFSFHAAPGPVTAHGLALVPQATGTYAGASVEQPPDTAPRRLNSSGFDWLGNVERDAAPPAQFAVDYTVADNWNVHDPDIDLHLRSTVIADFDEVALADGVPPRNKPGNPASLRYLIGRRTGTNLASQIVSVIEPYVGDPVIASVTPVTVTTDEAALAAHEVSAVRIELANGRVDYVVSSLRTDVLLDIGGVFKFRGSFGVFVVRGGAGEFAFSHGSTMLNTKQIAPGATAAMVAPAPAVSGTVKDFTTDVSVQNQVILTLAEELTEDLADLVGKYVYVGNDGARNAVYRIRVASLTDPLTLVLDIGDCTTIRRYLDDTDISRGYVYDLAKGAAAYIPVSRQWHAL